MMKRLLALSILCLGCLSSNAQVTVTPDQQTRAQAKIDYWGFRYDYMKFSDGIVIPIRRMAFRTVGVVFPKLNKSTPVTLRVVPRHKVMDSTSEGCRIELVDSEGDRIYTTTDNDMFVEGIAGYSGRTYGPLLLKKLPYDFTYTTVSGSTRTIPCYENSVPATRQEWNEFLKAHQ